MSYADRYRVEPKSKVKLKDSDAGRTGDIDSKSDGKKILKKNAERLAELQYLLYAENKHTVLTILQGMDAGGKDGAIRHVMTACNPQGVKVTSFKTPTAEELEHDYLWRIHKAMPRRGEIGIFNRSHYEDVLIVRVHDLVPKRVWKKRYRQINDFERTLTECGVTIVKFFLHIGKDEQKERLQDRLDEPDKHWKVNPADYEERKRWPEYQAAYEDALSKCSTRWAPWYVIPADHKWFRNVAISEILIETLEGLDMAFPKPQFDVSSIALD